MTPLEISLMAPLIISGSNHLNARSGIKFQQLLKVLSFTFS